MELGFPLLCSLGFPGSSAGKESTCNAGDPSSIPGLGRYTEEGIGYPLQYSWASLLAQLVKNPPAMWETWVQPLGWKDPLERGTATHSSILAWRIPWAIESLGSQRVRHDWVTFTLCCDLYCSSLCSQPVRNLPFMWGLKRNTYEAENNEILNSVVLAAKGKGVRVDWSFQRELLKGGYARSVLNFIIGLYIYPSLHPPIHLSSHTLIEQSFFKIYF